jgi:diguanylate cyclase (GGDEF)-like protein
VGDLASRWGGEEFTVALPGMPIQHAVQVAERLRREVAAATTGTCGVTMSVGVSAANLTPLDDVDDVLDQALREADRAMYLAKARGRDQVVMGDFMPEHRPGGVAGH